MRRLRFPSQGNQKLVERLFVVLSHTLWADADPQDMASIDAQELAHPEVIQVLSELNSEHTDRMNEWRCHNICPSLASGTGVSLLALDRSKQAMEPGPCDIHAVATSYGLHLSNPLVETKDTCSSSDIDCRDLGRSTSQQDDRVEFPRVGAESVAIDVKVAVALEERVERSERLRLRQIDDRCPIGLRYICEQERFGVLVALDDVRDARLRDRHWQEVTLNNVVERDG